MKYITPPVGARKYVYTHSSPAPRPRSPPDQALQLSLKQGRIEQLESELATLYKFFEMAAEVEDPLSNPRFRRLLQDRLEQLRGSCPLAQDQRPPPLARIRKY